MIALPLFWTRSATLWSTFNCPYRFPDSSLKLCALPFTCPIITYLPINYNSMAWTYCQEEFSKDTTRAAAADHLFVLFGLGIRRGIIWSPLGILPPPFLRRGKALNLNDLPPRPPHPVKKIGLVWPSISPFYFQLLGGIWESGNLKSNSLRGPFFPLRSSDPSPTSTCPPSKVGDFPDR
jgi:hypothetical protein